MEGLPPQTLTGKVAIVTGSSRGLGAVMAMDMAKRGAKVVLTYTSHASQPKVATLLQQISNLPNCTESIAVQGDLEDANVPKHIVHKTLEAFGPHIDILVNNAAIEIGNPVAQVSKEELIKVLSVNVCGPHLLVQAVLPHLRPPGRIINISSVGARAGFANLSTYVASKGALEAMTRCWAAEFGASGTTVNAVAPGPTESDMLANIPREIVDMQKANTPLQKRVGTPQEIADVTSWLASAESSWVTGQVLNVSGGWTMY